MMRLLSRRQIMGHTLPGDFGRSVFVCSKPLQALHCASIVRHYAINEARLHVVTRTIKDYEAFRAFFEASAHGSSFRSIGWSESYAEVIEWLSDCSYDSLFVEDDRASFYQLFAPLRTDRLVLFEEGIGTYRGTYNSAMRGARRIKWKLASIVTGCGFEFGEGRKTDVVMVHAPEIYRRMHPRLAKKVMGFPGLIDEIGRERSHWENAILETIPLDRSSFGDVALVLGTGGGAPATVLDEIHPEVDVVFYKAHPQDGLVTLDDRAVLIDASWVPAEVYIDLLSRRSRRVLVFHFSSSVAFYGRNLYSNVDFFDLLKAPEITELLRCAAEVSSDR